jgi:hypothetical protein
MNTLKLPKGLILTDTNTNTPVNKGSPTKLSASPILLNPFKFPTPRNLAALSPKKDPRDLMSSLVSGLVSDKLKSPLTHLNTQALDFHSPERVDIIDKDELQEENELRHKQMIELLKQFNALRAEAKSHNS